MSSKADPFNALRNKVIFGKYKVTKLLGRGSFGCVFQGINIKTKEIIALKFELRNSDSDLLKEESILLSILKGPGIPKIITFGRYYNFYVLVQEILGFNLLQIKSLIKQYTIKDIGMMGIQIMNRIEYIHSKNIIHRDIKPENFTTGYNDLSTIYLIDFGIARKYRSSRTLKHVKFELTGRMFGTVRYASYNASRGCQQSRRDDLESVGNMLIYLYTGVLPWKGINLKDKLQKKKYLDMLLLKKYTTNEVICNGMPKEFLEYYNYCRNLKFEQDPDYEYLRNCFRGMLKANLDRNDLKFSYLFNKNYLNKVREFNNKINIKQIEKYINTENWNKNNKNKSPNPRNNIYNKIKLTLQKNLDERYKNSIGQSENIFHDKMIGGSIIDLNSIKSYNKRGRSENATQMLERNDISENDNNLNKAKMDFTYRSNFANYNMEVAEFQDENKNYEQNKTLINQIKNSKNENLDINFNFNENLSYNIIVQSKNINIKKLLENFKMNDDIKNKINISMILEIKEFKNNNNISIKRTKSQIIKGNFSGQNKLLSDKEKNIKKEQIKLYNNIKNKIEKYLNKNKNYQNNKINKRNIIYKQNNIKTLINNNESSQDNFSFKNENITKKNQTNFSKGPNGQNKNRKYVKKTNIYSKKNGNLNNISKININNNITPIRTNKYMPNNNISRNEKNLNNGVNIYINTTVHTGYPSKKNNNNNMITIKKQSPNSLIPLTQNLVMNKAINNINTANIKQINMKLNPNKNIILIPKKQFPKISKNFYYTDLKYTFLPKNSNISSNIFNNPNNINSLRNTLKTNNNTNLSSSNSTIKTFDYKPIYMRQRNSPPNNNNNLNIKRILLFDNNIKANNMRNLRPKKITKNHSYDPILNKIKYQNMANMVIRKNSPEKMNQIFHNIQNNNIIFQNKENKQKYNYELNNKMNKIKIRHYSPDNNIEKNKYNSLIKKEGIFTNIIRQNRSNSNSGEKKGLNYNYLNLRDKNNSINFPRQPRNLNNWNFIDIDNFESRCINRIKI